MEELNMKKAISVLLCFVMVIGVFCSTPMTVFAVEMENVLGFYLNNTETGYIVSCIDSEYEGDIVIPAEYEGLPVTEIDGYGFYYCYKIKSITIPETIEIIKGDAFNSCTGLTEIIVDENNQHFKSIDGILYNKDVTELITIPAAMTGAYVMPETLTQVRIDSFSTSKISSITLNSKIEAIDVYSLRFGCTNLAEVNVSPENQFFSSENGVLFNKDKTELIICPSLDVESYTVPESVTKICSYAFSYTDIPSIIVGGNVKSVADRAFWNSNIKNVSFQEGIEYLGSELFRSCNFLKSVKIPSNVKAVYSLFVDCANLEEVELGDNIEKISVSIFKDITNLKKLTLGNNYGEVVSHAFSGVDSVDELHIKDIENWIPISFSASDNLFLKAQNIYVNGKDITEITELAISKETDFTANTALFRRLTSLTEFKIAEGADHINYAVRDGVLYDDSVTNIIKYPTGKTGEYVIPETVRTISAHAFDGVIGLTEIEIPDEVFFLNDYMFANCPNLERVVLPENATKVPVGAFSNCTNLKSIDLGSALEVIDQSAFANTGLTEITIPDTIQYLYSTAFYNSQNLATVRMGKSIINVHESAFSNCPVKDYYVSSEVVTPRSVLGVDATAIHFTDGVKEISAEAFAFKKSIKEISFSDTVETIGSKAFADCKNLNAINFGTALLEVGSEAFVNCTSLQKVNIKNLHFWCNVRFSDSEANPLYYAQNLYVNDVLVEELEIPNGVIAVENYVFANCKSIKKITIPESVKTLGTMAFVGVSLEQLYIPDIKHWCEINIKNGASLQIEEDVTEVFVGGEKITELVIPDGVTKIPASAFRGWYFLESVTFNDDVTEIGDFAFCNCTNIKEITLPDTVKYIGSYAFSLCYALETLDLGNGLEDIMYYAFQECISLKKVVIPDSVTTLEFGAFNDCIGLKEIVFGDGLLFVPDNTFSNCIAIESITFGKNIQYLEDSFYDCPALKEIRVKDLASWCEMEKGYFSLSQIERFYVNDELLEGELIIPEGVNRISSRSFHGYSLITSITISDSVTEIGEYAFGECANLEKVTFGSGVKTLSGVFLYASDKLTEVVLSEGIERIEESVFSSLDNLVKITLPKSLKYVAAEAFDSGYLLKDVYYNSDLTDWMNIEFEAGYYPNFNGASLYLNGELLENLVIPEEFTEIPKCAFAGVKSIKSVEMHDNVEVVSNGAFMYCSSIKSLKLSKNLTEIGNYAFKNCSGLEAIDLPKKLTAIGEEAFSSCNGLTVVDIPEGVSVIPRRLFAECKNLENVRLHNGLTIISAEAFYNCQRLSSINIPKTVTYVGNSAFKKSGLTYVYGEPYTMAETVANSYNAQFIDSTTLFAPVGENKQNGVCVVTDAIMQTNVNDLVKTFNSYYEARVLESSGGNFLGTGSIIGVYDTNSGNLVSEIVVVVKGDLNGDGVCDALDCMLAELTRTSCIELKDEYLTAADYTEDSEVDLDDFQQIVNKAVNREVA